MLMSPIDGGGTERGQARVNIEHGSSILGGTIPQVYIHQRYVGKISWLNILLVRKLMTDIKHVRAKIKLVA